MAKAIHAAATMYRVSSPGRCGGQLNSNLQVEVK